MLIKQKGVEAVYGYSGNIAKVDLSTGSIVTETFDDDFARRFIGGNGFVAKLVYDNVPLDTGPLDPENGVAIAVGPLTDSPIWGTSRGHLGTIAPQTGLFADGNYGGDFGMALKRSGYEAILITGAADKPVYLHVTDEGISIEDASDLWGKSTGETTEILAKRAGEGAAALSIGPGGENGVVFANVCSGGRRFGMAGRGGAGTVMGSKNLKAVVARGKQKAAIYDAKGLKVFLKKKLPELRKNKGVMTKLGTSALTNLINAKGLLGTRNNQRETFDRWQEISGDFYLERYQDRDTACHGCILACGKNVKIDRGEYRGKSVKMPEYETLYSMGAMNDNSDIMSIIIGNHLCDEMGIDTISMGVTLSFVAECIERGIITESDLGGTVKFDNGEVIADLISKTVKREGIGAYLAMGSRRIAKHFGGDAYKCLYEVQGLEIAGHSARGLRGMSLAYATSTRGGSHHDARPDYANHADPSLGFETIPDYVMNSNYFTCLGDSLVVCRFIEEGMMNPPAVSEDMAAFLNYITGWNLTADDLKIIGERIYNLERLINTKRGVSRKDDILPYRVMNEPIPDGPAKGLYVPNHVLDRMLDQYYELRGWSKEGRPTNEKLGELGLI